MEKDYIREKRKKIPPPPKKKAASPLVLCESDIQSLSPFVEQKEACASAL